MLSYMLTWLNVHLSREEGQGMAEYGLILALVAVLLIAAFTGLKDGIDGVLDQIVNAF